MAVHISQNHLKTWYCLRFFPHKGPCLKITKTPSFPPAMGGGIIYSVTFFKGSSCISSYKFI
ncbi:MAG: hypothetical protein LBR79_01020 [Oscillospiraceae bacterium]|nr:hypothetical protein [Oscillospiraceae bacterium]